MFYSIDNIAPLCQSLHSEGKKITLATGFFDLLHQEHLNFLHKAKNLGDILIVAVESDARARVLKGEGRPVEPQLLRCQKVSALADYVLALDASFNNLPAYEALMSAIRPEFYAVSSHSSHLASKTLLTEKYGGRLVVVHDFNPAISTTKILQNTKI